MCRKGKRMDRNKVIKGLEVCSDLFGNCYDCPYMANGGDPEQCDRQAFKDALVLLKEQEEQVQIAHEEGFHDGYMQAMSETSPCRECQEFDCDGCEHKAVKWDE